MPGPALLRIDTNLLVLLVAGMVSPDIILRHKHKRLKKYYVDDFFLLCNEIGSRRLCLLPNVATESHNILKQHGEPERSALLAKLGEVILDSVENYVPNKIAVLSRVYSAIGLTDAALFETHAPELLTDDRELYAAAQADGQQATYFLYLRIKEGTLVVPA